MSTNPAISKKRLETFKDFLKYIISEYKNEIEQQKCSNSILKKLILENTTDRKIKSHISLLRNIISSCNMKLYHNEEEEIIIAFLIDYFKNANKRIVFTQNNLEKTFSQLVQYLENESKYSYNFSPLYNFKSDIEIIEINDSTTIRKISSVEKEKIMEYYQEISEVKSNLNKVTHVISTKINREVKDPQSVAKEQIQNVYYSLKVFKEGNLKIGGLYKIKFSENWNPIEQIDKIDYEPFKTWKKNKFLLDNKKNFEKFFEKLNKCYPNVKNREFFDIVIRRFGTASEQKNKIDEITDFVIALESLLVRDGGGVGPKLTHRATTMLGSSDKEMSEILRFIPFAYDIRSGNVHGDVDRSQKNGMSLDDASKKMEILTRLAIKKMIIFSQIPENIEKEHDSLIKQIHNMIFNKEQLDKFGKITKI